MWQWVYCDGAGAGAGVVSPPLTPPPVTLLLRLRRMPLDLAALPAPHDDFRWFSHTKSITRWLDAGAMATQGKLPPPFFRKVMAAFSIRCIQYPFRPLVELTLNVFYPHPLYSRL